MLPPNPCSAPPSPYVPLHVRITVDRHKPTPSLGPLPFASPRVISRFPSIRLSSGVFSFTLLFLCIVTLLHPLPMNLFRKSRFMQRRVLGRRRYICLSTNYRARSGFGIACVTNRSVRFRNCEINYRQQNLTARHYDEKKNTTDVILKNILERDSKLNTFLLYRVS